MWDDLDLSALRKLRQQKAEQLQRLEAEEREAGVRLADTLRCLCEEREGVLREKEEAKVKQESAAAEVAADAAAPPAQTAHTETDYEGIDSDEEAAPAPVAGGTRLEGAWRVDTEGQRTPVLPVRVRHTEEKGRTLVATRSIARGEVILYDASVLDIPSSVDACLLSSAFAKAVDQFRAAARAGKAVLPHEMKTKELEAGVVLLSKVKKEGKDALQAFDLAAVNVTGVSFRDGVLPVLVQYLEASQTEGAQCSRVLDLCCPIKEGDAHTVARYLALSKAFLQSLGKLPQYQTKLTVDQAVRLLVTVQCNSVAVRRAGSSGLSVFPNAALMEHSCDPNASAVILHRTGDNDEAVVKVVAARHIPEGEAVSINYGTSYRPWEERQAMLQGSHFFTCRCTLCTEGADRCRSFTSSPDPRYRAPASLQEADAALQETLQAALEGTLAAPSVTMPLCGGKRWVGARSLNSDVAADNLEISRCMQAEAAAVKKWEALRGDCEQGEWDPLEEWFGSEAVLHPSHHAMISVAVQCLPLAFRQGSAMRVLWLLRCMTLGNLWVEGAQRPEPVASTIAEYCDVAARITRADSPASAEKYCALGEALLSAASHTETVRHKQLQRTASSLSG